MDRLKLTLFVSGEVVKELRALAETRGITITTEKYLADAITDGDVILLERPDGTRRREIVLR